MTTDIGSLSEGLLFTLIFVSIMLNGLIVLINTALNNVNRNKVKQMLNDHEKGKTAKQMLGLLEKPSDYRFTNRLLCYAFIGCGMYFTMKLPYNDTLSFVLFVIASAIVSPSRCFSNISHSDNAEKSRRCF